MTQLTTQNLIKMFYNATYGELTDYPTGFNVDTGSIDVPLSLYATTQENGGEMMYEYDRRTLANRIVGTNKRVFLHHEELDAYVDKSESR